MTLRIAWVSTLSERTRNCRADGDAGVSATPTISGDIAYYPTWSGLLVALNYRTCDVIWRLNVTALVLNYAPLTPEQSLTNPVSRTSPQLDNGILYIGTLAHALLVAVDARTGSVLDMLNINPHPQAIITMSPTVYRGRVFVGTSSEEETAAALVPGYTCCSFVGNMVGVDFDRNTERLDLAWNTSMITDADFCQGWTGAALWGSQPSIDEMRSQVKTKNDRSRYRMLTIFDRSSSRRVTLIPYHQVCRTYNLAYVIDS